MDRHYPIYQKIFFIVIFLMANIMLYGQENWSMDKFLLQAYQSPSLQFEDKKIEMLTEGNYRLPLIENLQFRTETRDFELDQQDYDLRLNTNSFRSINAQEDINKTELAINELHRSIVLKNELANRYNVILSLVFQRDLLAILNEKLAIQNDKLVVLKTMSSWDLPKVKELVKIESSIVETDLERIKTESSLGKLQDRINEMCGSEISIKTDDIIAARFIREKFDQIILSDSVASKQMEMVQLEIDRNKHEQVLQKTEMRKLVKFYQLGYRDSDSPFEQTQFSMGIGFNLPFKGSEKLKEAELKLENLELSSDYESELNELRQEQYEIITSLEFNINEFETLQGHFDRSLAKKTLEKYREFPEISALSILYLKEHDLNQKEQLMNSEFELYRDYIDALEIFNLLDKKPFKNYLSISHFGY